MAAVVIASAWALRFAHSPMVFWVGVTLAVVLGWFFANWKRISITLLNRFGFFLVLVAAVRIGIVVVIIVPRTDLRFSAGNGEVKPDIFWIVLDGHGRSDEIKRNLGVDNSSFVKELENSGMTVRTDSVANYCHTVQSVGSALNLAPAQIPNPEIAAYTINRPRLVSALRAQGYKSIAVRTGFPAFRFEGFDLVYGSSDESALFEGVLLDGFPIASSTEGESRFEARRTQLRSGLKTLQYLIEPTTKPRFIFAHILAPHPPFVFDATGAPVRLEGAFNFSDGSDYITDEKARIRYREGFAGQLKWVDSQVELVIREIKRRQKRPTILIVMGDHGSKLCNDQENLEQTDVQELFPILFAYSLLPGMGAPKGRTPLEILGDIFDDVLGYPFAIRAKESWFSPKSNLRDLTDVTDRVR